MVAIVPGLIENTVDMVGISRACKSTRIGICSIAPIELPALEDEFECVRLESLRERIIQREVKMRYLEVGIVTPGDAKICIVVLEPW